MFHDITKLDALASDAIQKHPQVTASLGLPIRASAAME
jgi:hypothetical protein